MANFGILLIYVLGYMLDWWLTSLVCLVLTVPPFLLLSFSFAVRGIIFLLLSSLLFAMR